MLDREPIGAPDHPRDAVMPERDAHHPAGRNLRLELRVIGGLQDLHRRGRRHQRHIYKACGERPRSARLVAVPCSVLPFLEAQQPDAPAVEAEYQPVAPRLARGLLAPDPARPGPRGCLSTDWGRRRGTGASSRPPSSPTGCWKTCLCAPPSPIPMPKPVTR